MLIALIKQQNIQVPQEIEETVILNDYAVETRYPGEYEPVNEEEYFAAIKLATEAVRWVGNQLTK
jgi:HEPN domain-containing protein